MGMENITKAIQNVAAEVKSSQATPPSSAAPAQSAGGSGTGAMPTMPSVAPTKSIGSNTGVIGEAVGTAMGSIGKIGGFDSKSMIGKVMASSPSRFGRFVQREMAANSIGGIESDSSTMPSMPSVAPTKSIGSNTGVIGEAVGTAMGSIGKIGGFDSKSMIGKVMASSPSRFGRFVQREMAGNDGFKVN